MLQNIGEHTGVFSRENAEVYCESWCRAFDYYQSGLFCNRGWSTLSEADDVIPLMHHRLELVEVVSLYQRSQVGTQLVFDSMLSQMGGKEEWSPAD